MNSVDQRLEYQKRASHGVWCPVKHVGEVAISSVSSKKFKDKFRKTLKVACKRNRVKDFADLPPDVQREVTVESVFKGCAHAWRSQDEDGNWHDTVPGKGGTELEFNKENFSRLCDEDDDEGVWGFLEEILDYAGMEATFEEEFHEEVEGN